jgi:hypothetical protein
MLRQKQPNVARRLRHPSYTQLQLQRIPCLRARSQTAARVSRRLLYSAKWCRTAFVFALSHHKQRDADAGMKGIEKKVLVLDVVDIALIRKQPICRPGIKKYERVSRK